MSVQTVEQLCFRFIPQRPVIVQRCEGQITSDAGLLPIRQFDEQRRYTRRMAACLIDHRRDPEHTIRSMLQQRLYGILADYEDCNDHDDLRNDPIFKMIAGRLPEDNALASQPTLSRFENGITPAMLQRMLAFLIDTGIEQLKHTHGGELPESVTLDIDPTDIATHGNQQLTLFHGYYDQYQYLPQIISEPTTKHVFLAHLRFGTMHPSLGADDDLDSIIDALRDPDRGGREDLAVHVRGDAAFGVPRVMDFCENTRHTTYTFGMPRNARLQRRAQDLMDRAVAQFEQSGLKQRLFTFFSYQADSWDHPRMVIAKAECMSRGTNLRFVVTNLPVASSVEAERVYDDYIQRGESEQRMDELKNGLHADRLSCHRFMANFFRLLLHTAAFNLINAIRHSEQIPDELRCAQPATWRSRLIKVAATVVQSARRIVVKLAGQWPHWPQYRAVAHRVITVMPGGP